jgi:hypothetical protein
MLHEHSRTAKLNQSVTVETAEAAIATTSPMQANVVVPDT